MKKAIKSFSVQYRFLSNFQTATVVYEGHSYRSVEHAFQAAKTLDPVARAQIRNCTMAADAKKLGKKVQLRDGWDDMRIDVMRDLLRQKFGTDPMRKKLLNTGQAELIEGNWWGDKFWGVCDGVGQNHLGKLLMQVRDELREKQGQTTVVVP